MDSVNEKKRYYITPSLTHRTHTQNDSCMFHISVVRLKLPGGRMFVQELVETNIKWNVVATHLMVLCDENPSVTGGPTKGQQSRQSAYGMSPFGPHVAASPVNTKTTIFYQSCEDVLIFRGFPQEIVRLGFYTNHSLFALKLIRFGPTQAKQIFFRSWLFNAK